MSNNLHTSLFDLSSIHQKYWKDFCDVCYSRFGFEQGEVRTYEQKYETFCRCKNYVTSEEGYEEQLLMTKDEDLKRLYDVLILFNNLRDAKHMIPMLLSINSMVKTIVESLNADKELIKRVSPRTMSIDYKRYCHLFQRKPEYREDVINDIRLKDFEDGWLKDILLRTDLSHYKSDKVSRSAREVARALMNQVVISINELVAILPEEGSCPHGTELQAFLYQLFMSYETSLADIKEELEEYPAGLGLDHLKRECKELINDFKQTHLGSHWCNCIEHANGLQSIAKYFMHHRKLVSEEEERAFFYTLDKICIIYDILNGKSDKYWLDVEYPKIDQAIAHVDKNESPFNKNSQILMANVEDTKVGPMDDVNTSDQQTSPEILNELLPIFYNNHQAVSQFLNTIKGANNTMITSTVKKLVSQGIINERAKNSKLYIILKNHGSYNASLSTWNKQV